VQVFILLCCGAIPAGPGHGSDIAAQQTGMIFKTNNNKRPAATHAGQ
jgi:hypothetical protein